MQANRELNEEGLQAIVGGTNVVQGGACCPCCGCECCCCCCCDDDHHVDVNNTTNVIVNVVNTHLGGELGSGHGIISGQETSNVGTTSTTSTTSTGGALSGGHFASLGQAASGWTFHDAMSNLPPPPLVK